MKNTYKGKYKKAARGLQSVAVPEQGSASNVLSSATSMASSGASIGSLFPGVGTAIGAGIGGALGLATGFMQKNEQDKANRDAVNRNKYLAANRAVDGVDESVDQKTQVFKKGGRVNTKTIEIEGKGTPEIHTDKNFNVKNLGTTPHTKGGNKVEASEGDIVFNTQNSLTKYNKIAAAISNGDKQTLNKEKNRLPEDTSDKNQDGNKGVKKPTKLANTNPDWNYALPKAPVSTYAPNSSTAAMRRISNAPIATAKNISNSISLANQQRDKARRTQYETSRRTEYSPVRADLDKQYLAANAAYDKANNITAGSAAKPATTTKSTTPTTAFDYKNPLAIPGVPSTSTNKLPLSQLPKSGVKPKEVAVAGRKINTSTTPVIPAKTFNTNYLNSKADRGNANDLAPENKPFEFAKSNVPDPLNPASKTLTAGQAPNTSTTTQASSTVGNIAQFAGVANNLYQGLKTEKPIVEKYFDPELNKYVDRSENLRQQSTSAANIQNANARNVSGGNAGNMRANQNQAALSNLTRQDAINEQEMSRRDAIETSNTGIKNAAGQYNLQRKDMYQGQIDGTRAAKQSYVDQAATDIGQYGLSKREEQYMRDKDDKANAVQLAGLNRIKTSDFATDVNGNQVTALGTTPAAITPSTSTFPVSSTTPAFNSQTLFTGKQTPKQKAGATTIAPPAIKQFKYTKRR